MPDSTALTEKAQDASDVKDGLLSITSRGPHSANGCRPVNMLDDAKHSPINLFKSELKSTNKRSCSFLCGRGLQMALR